MNEVYLDNSSTTRVCETAAAKVMELMTENYGNPSSLHALGFRAEQALTQARRSVAAALGAKEEEVFFTSGGTESNNLAIFGAAYARKRMGMHIVTTQIEHPSVANAVRQLEKEGWEVTWLQPDREGHIAPEAVLEAVRPDTTLVSMMAVNNEVGTILPIEAAARAIALKKAPALLHVDAVQAFGKLDTKPERKKIDLMSISAHKIHGPKGVGALYVRKGVRIQPHSFGGRAGARDTARHGGAARHRRFWRGGGGAPSGGRELEARAGACRGLPGKIAGAAPAWRSIRRRTRCPISSISARARSARRPCSISWRRGASTCRPSRPPAPRGSRARCWRPCSCPKSGFNRPCGSAFPGLIRWKTWTPSSKGVREGMASLAVKK